MAKPRSYKLLCPIARALDRIGDRWTLLILRDLHAGPARFTDLQQGLTGIAANLLTDRLVKLGADGLIAKGNGPHGATLYELTELGRKTHGLIFHLAMFGALFPSEDEVARPGNLRTVAVTLDAAAQRADIGDLNVVAGLDVDSELFELRAACGTAHVRYGAATNPDVELRTSYTALIAVSESDMDEQTFLERHCNITVQVPGKEQDMYHLLRRILSVFQDSDVEPTHPGRD